MSSVVVVTKDRAFHDRVEKALHALLNGDLRHWAGEVGSEVPFVADDTRVVLVGPDVGPTDAFDLAHAIDLRFPHVIVVVAIDPSPELWRKALHAGVRDIVAPSADDDELRWAVNRALEAAGHRRRELTPATDGPGARVITVVSPKGGAGKTFVASNLAVGLARHEPGGVVLVDLDLQFGDVGHALLLMPENTMADAARARGLDPTTLKVFLTSYESSLYALCAPESPAEGEAVPPEKVAEVLDLLMNDFSYVVNDTSSGVSDTTLEALDRSTDIVLVSDMDVPSIRALQKLLVAVDRLGMVFSRRYFVLNRSNSSVGLKEDDIEDTLGLEIDVRIPSSRHVPLSINQGQPLLLGNPRSPAARPLEDLVRRIAGVPRERSSGLPWRRISS